MIRFRSVLAGGVIAGLLVSGVAFAQGPRLGGTDARGARGAMGGPGLALRGLNLTDAQRSLIRDVQQRHREATREAQAQLRQALAAQRQAVEVIPLNEGLIRATTQELAEAQTAVAIQRARVHSEVWSVLTPEQQEQATKLRAQREQRMSERRPQMQERLQGRQPRR